MRLKSRGLGRKELVMDFREYEAIREGTEIIIVGTIREPVTWDFSIRMCEDDISGMAQLLRRRSVIKFVWHALFKRNSDHHWEAERSEHIAKGKEFLIDAKEKARAREIAYEEAWAAAREEEAAEGQEVAASSAVGKA
jgi:hypothetical protein